MAQYNRISWVSAATRGAALGKEYSDAWQELSDHIQDHTEALMAAGFSKEAAEEQAVTAMGDPQEVNRLLRKIHRPVLTRILQISKVLLCLAALVVLLTTLREQPWDAARYRSCFRVWATGSNITLEDYLAPVPSEHAPFAESTLYRRSGKAFEQARVGDCVFTVTRYAVSRVDSAHYGDWMLALQIEMEPAHFWQPDPKVPGHFSLANDQGIFRTEAGYDKLLSEGTHNICLEMREGRKDIHMMYAWFPGDSKWVDLIYTDAENTFTLRVDTEGGTVYEAPCK